MNHLALSSCSVEEKGSFLLIFYSLSQPIGSPKFESWIHPPFNILQLVEETVYKLVLIRYVNKYTMYFTLPSSADIDVTYEEYQDR